MSGAGVLVAGIGNAFLGDDAFGPAVARQLLRRDLPAGICVRDLGTRGLELAHALADPWAAVVLVDLAQRGQPAGTLYLIDPLTDPLARSSRGVEPHGVTPERAIAYAAELVAELPQMRLVGCEPACLRAGWMELSEPVRAALPAAERLVLETVAALQRLPSARA